jgi:hypothetical protein
MAGLPNPPLSPGCANVCAFVRVCARANAWVHMCLLSILLLQAFSVRVRVHAHVHVSALRLRKYANKCFASTRSVGAFSRMCLHCTSLYCGIVCLAVCVADGHNPSHPQKKTVYPGVVALIEAVSCVSLLQFHSNPHGMAQLLRAHAGASVGAAGWPGGTPTQRLPCGGGLTYPHVQGTVFCYPSATKESYGAAGLPHTHTHTSDYSLRTASEVFERSSCACIDLGVAGYGGQPATNRHGGHQGPPRRPGVPDVSTQGVPIGASAGPNGSFTTAQPPTRTWYLLEFSLPSLTCSLRVYLVFPRCRRTSSP